MAKRTTKAAKAEQAEEAEKVEEKVNPEQTEEVEQDEQDEETTDEGEETDESEDTPPPDREMIMDSQKSEDNPSVPPALMVSADSKLSPMDILRLAEKQRRAYVMPQQILPKEVKLSNGIVIRNS